MIKSVDVMCSTSYAMSVALSLANSLDELRVCAECAMCDNKDEYPETELLKHGGEILHHAHTLVGAMEDVRKLIDETTKCIPQLRLVDRPNVEPTGVVGEKEVN